LAKGGWVCGIDAGSFKTPSYIAWLSGSSFLLDLCSPTVTQPLPKPPSGVHNVQSYAIDAPQGLPGIGRERRRWDELAGTPTRVLPQTLHELEHRKLYKGLIELGVKTFRHIYESADIHVFGLDDSYLFPVAAETYPRKVAETMGLKRLPSKRREPVRYVDYVWHFFQSLGYGCESVLRPSVDHVDAMLCAIAAHSWVADRKTCEALGEKPYVD